MTYYRDLGMKTMVTSGRYVRAVGWLHRDCDYPRGTVSRTFLRRLKLFCGRWREGTEALGWGGFRGRHRCELCGKVQMHGNLGVPYGPLLFVAPEMIAHYVESDGYLPPAVFQEAVLAAPLPGTREYAAAVARFRALHRRAAAQRRRRWRRPGGRQRALRWFEGDRIPGRTEETGRR